MSVTPVIGISAISSSTPSSQAIMEQLRSIGATPLLFVSHAKRRPVDDIEKIDGLILMGNDFDIDPSLYLHRYSADDPKRSVHPETRSELACPESTARSTYEVAMIELALKRRMPVMGICGGMQRINVHLGGTLHQHIPDLVGDNKHCQRSQGIDPCTPMIPVLIEMGTKLSLIAGDIPMSFTTTSDANSAKVITENSIHHQAVDMLAPGLKICAISDGIRFKDGSHGYLVKAYESHPDGPYAHQCLIGIQWHPEFGASPLGIRLARHLIEESAIYKIAR